MGRRGGRGGGAAAPLSLSASDFTHTIGAVSDASRRYPLIDLDGIARAEGRFLLDGPNAILKGVLESEIQIDGLVIDFGSRFDSVLMVSQDPAVATVLQRNRCVVLRRRTPERRIVEAGRLAQQGPEGSAAVAVIQNAEIPRAVAAIERGGEEARAGTVMLVVDEPERHGAIAAWPLLSGLEVPIVQPRNLDTLRGAVEHAARLSHEAGRPAAIVVDESLLRTLEMLEVRPNRVVETVDVAVAMRRRRSPRHSERGDLLRLARRLDLDRVTAMPSPGEVEPLGLISAGIASTAVTHVLEDLRLTGRVPTVQLDLVNPLDPASIERMLLRCSLLLIVETRPGRLAGAILEISENLRRRGETVAELAWRELPGDDSIVLEPGDAGRPSILARKLMNILQPIRPTLRVEEKLAEVDERSEESSLPPRRGRRERARLLGAVRRSVVAAERDLREGDEDHEPMAFAINGRQPIGFAGPVVSLELLQRHDLLRQIVPMVAARVDRPWVLVIADDAAGDELDAVRIVGAAVPADIPDPPTVRGLVLKSESELRDQIKVAARAAEPSILVVRRSSELGAAIADKEEIDRLGYAPSVRIKATLDAACAVRSREDPIEDRDIQAPSELPARLEVDRARGQRLTRWALRIRPLVEVAEVVRTRPPLPSTPVASDREISAPSIVHAKRGMWRAHVAGTRGRAQGAAASAIALAGIDMGFNVRVLHLPESIGDGRSAWSQILFTRPGRDESPPTRTAGIPYGEADLLLGVDPTETLRALGLDPVLCVATAGRTSIIGNIQALGDQRDVEDSEVAEKLQSLAAASCGTEFDYLSALAGIVDRQFGNERLLDMVLLGIAFQKGLVPVTPAVMRQAVGKLESGFGRSVEAYEFGRQLALGERRPRKTEPVRNPHAILREVVLERRFARGMREAGWLRSRLTTVLDRMPGLLETESGRRAAIDLVQGSAALLRWGRRKGVEQFISQIEEVYRMDRGDTGRELTRMVILPLAEAMLMRDIIYSASVAIGFDHRRKVRRRLGVRTGRGDQMEIVYLLQADLIAFGRRIRSQLPARAWLLRTISGLGRFVPSRLRGTAASRRRRAIVLESIQSALAEAGDTSRYHYWCEHFQRLHEHAVDGTFHTLVAADVEPRRVSSNH